jgi:pyruvate dehydrogenase E1 component beta subunit
MVVEALRAKHLLETVDIAAEVIDPVTLAPLDIETIAASVERTGRVLIVDNSWTMCGASSEILAQLMERLQTRRAFRATRLGYAPTPCPTTKPLENLFYPNAVSIAEAAYAVVKEKGDWKPVAQEAKEIAEFKGPF